MSFVITHNTFAEGIASDGCETLEPITVVLRCHKVEFVGPCTSTEVVVKDRKHISLDEFFDSILVNGHLVGVAIRNELHSLGLSAISISEGWLRSDCVMKE
jgi:hypothetical protein